MYKETAKQVLDFIQKSPSCFHAVAEMAAMLKNAGYEELRECESWELKRGGKYFTTRNGSSLIAFAIGNDLDDYHFQVTSSHSDSPTFKVKEVAELIHQAVRPIRRPDGQFQSADCCIQLPDFVQP